MDPAGVITVAVPTGVVVALAPVALKWLQQRLRPQWASVTPTALPKSSAASDARFRAIMIEGAERVESLHEALAIKNPNTGAFVILEWLNSVRQTSEKQTEILGKQTELLKEQTELLRKLAEPRESLGRYRG